MGTKEFYEKGKKLLDYIENEINKPHDNYNYETRIWSRGYKAAMRSIKNFIWHIFNEED